MSIVDLAKSIKQIIDKKEEIEKIVMDIIRALDELSREIRLLRESLDRCVCRERRER